MTAAVPIAWSHSRADKFKTCPKMYNEEVNLKTVPFNKTEPMMEGDRVHKMLEARIKDQTPLAPAYQKLEQLVLPIEQAPGQTYAEQKWTINAQLQPTGWFAKDAWCRMIVDVMKMNPTHDALFMGDWKTGKPNFDEHQLKLFAAGGFIYFPSVQKITTAYIWTKANMIDPKVYHRSDVPRMWQELLQIPTRIQEATNNNHWPAKPGPRCKWCGVNKQRRCAEASEPYRGN